ncbi:branched-chain amino acid transport system permease protein [Variovorax boronicumulans]|uniref:branched-chain amino acid ABC transporter permease n=1 Tax=Variovorax boronicumulans TaxID=436515 RepID=UPI002789793E|nr:branched-chain amino acid ABC transporter permease [Variovorax boronicumulans]MDP9995207.1 branched-chain amino acid transport system permease protein [Variovorax boronicumulans]MDQ0006497.1 branched-chain amino acid transport system permease protein [Variovorax boronicumulans]
MADTLLPVANPVVGTGDSARRRASLGVALICVALLAAVPLAASALGDTFYVRVVTRMMIFAIMAISLDLVLGFGGMVCFGHAMFVGAAAYVVGIFVFHASSGEPLTIAGVAFQGSTNALVIWPVAIATSALLALVFGAIALRTSGLYFIMITLAFAQMLYFVAASASGYGGIDGLTLDKAPTLGPLDTGDRQQFYWVVLAALAAAYLLCRRIVESRFGLVLRASRSNPTRLSAVGVSPYRYRLAAFVIAGALAGLAGVLLASSQSFVSPADMSWSRSGELIVMVVLGGMATLYGPIFGAFFYLAAEFALGHLTEHWQLVMGPLVIVVVLFGKGGLAGLWSAVRRGETP